MSSREEFEKWFLGEQGKPYDGMYSFAKAAWQAATERSAKVCDDYASSRWDLYKGRPPFNGSEEGRASPHVQGESCGAEDCADLIRKGNE